MEQAFAAKTGDLLIKIFSDFMFFEKFRQDFVRKSIGHVILWEIFDESLVSEIEILRIFQF